MSLISANTANDLNGGSEDQLDGESMYADEETRGPLTRTTICSDSIFAWFKDGEGRIRKRRRWWIISGILIASALSTAAVLLHHPGYTLQHDESYRQSFDSSWLPWLVQAVQFPSRPSTAKAILDYLDLFRFANNSPHLKEGQRQNQRQRRLSTGTPSAKETVIRGSQLVVAGKMTVEDAPCNIAQLNLKTNEWSLAQRIQLSLYNSYSGGEVYSLLANHSFAPFPEDDDAAPTR